MLRRAAAVAMLLALGLPAPARAQREARAVFAGGCFWSIEHAFEQIPGVVEAVSGFTGGREQHPTYDEVSQGRTGHLEAVEVAYDPAVIGYRALVDAFWRMIDPTDAEGQACDRGAHYRAAVFADGEVERSAAVASREAIDTGPRRGLVVTPILDAQEFWPAGPEHQDFHSAQTSTYALYREMCDRERVLAQVWADDSP